MSRTFLCRTLALSLFTFLIGACEPEFGGQASSKREPADNSDILAIAHQFPNGGGYGSLKGSGCPEEIIFNDTLILRKGEGGAYCCGFTFAVVVRAARDRGLLDGVSLEEFKRFQSEWYGVAKGSEEKEVVPAIEHLNIGYEVPMEEAQPGDFIQLWYGSTGHSVVFLGWEKKDGKIVAMHYRSSQSNTNGIGDATEYFSYDGSDVGAINPQRVYVARLCQKPKHS